MLTISHYISLLKQTISYRIDIGLIVAACLAGLVIQPLLQPGLPTAADIPIHLYRTVEYAHAWSTEVITPRWAPNLAFGYGYPLFVFAPPLPYMIGLMIQAVGVNFATALKLLMILTILLYATGMYLLARDVWQSIPAGLMAAAAYVLAPFALREVLLYGGNIPQFLAIGLFPWTLWAMNRLVDSWLWVIVASLMYAGIMLSHLFQVLIVTPAVLLWGVMLIYQHRPGLWTAMTYLLPVPVGALLSAFFWLPAFIERYATRAQADIYLDKSPFFIRYPHWTELVAWLEPLDVRAANPEVPLTLGIITLSLATLGVLSSIIGQTTNRRLPASFGLTGGYFGLIALGATFMSLPISRPVWETITILQVAEFPWRMLGLANLGWACLVGASVWLWPPRWQWPYSLLCLLIQIAASAPLLYPVTPFTQYGDTTLADQIAYERRSQSIGTTTLGEYLPQTVEYIPTGSPMVDQFQANQLPERLDRTSLPPSATATLVEQTAVSHHYQLDSPTDFTLRMYQYVYPGWRATLDGQPLPITPEPHTGLILVPIPAGQHQLRLHFGETPLRIISLVISGLTMGGIVLLVIGWRIRSLLLTNKAGQTRGLSLSKSPLLSTSSGEETSCPKNHAYWLLTAGFIIIIALGLQPRLRPVFTLHSPADRALPADQPVNIQFERGVRLIGYEMAPGVVPAGGRLEVVLYWQADTAPIEANLQPFVHLDRLDDLTTAVANTNYTPGDVTTESVLPTFHWDTGRYIRDDHALMIPADLPPIAYAVRVGLIDPDNQGRLLTLADGRGDTAWLTTINVSPADWGGWFGGNQKLDFWSKPSLPQLPVTFHQNEETIQLVDFTGYETTPHQLEFTLQWRSEQQLQTDYTIFAQLLDAEGNLVASFDSPPLAGAYPTTTWLPQQTISDRRHIPWGDVPPGKYRLIVGVYQPATSQRMVTETGNDFVALGTVKK